MVRIYAYCFVIMLSYFLSLFQKMNRDIFAAEINRY